MILPSACSCVCIQFPGVISVILHSLSKDSFASEKPEDVGGVGTTSDNPASERSASDRSGDAGRAGLPSLGAGVSGGVGAKSSPSFNLFAFLRGCSTLSDSLHLCSFPSGAVPPNRERFIQISKRYHLLVQRCIQLRMPNHRVHRHEGHARLLCKGAREFVNGTIIFLRV